MRQLPLVEQAMGRQTIALLRQLDATCISAEELAEATDASFSTHPDAPIINSFPGIGKLTGARVFAEIGDDRSRFRDARGLKAYAGAAPVTRASGKRSTVLARRIKNQRLAGVGYVWAFAAMAHSDGARAHYDRRREASGRHTASPTQSLQPLDRLPAPLPHSAHPLRRNHRFPSALEARSPTRCLTAFAHRMSSYPRRNRGYRG